MPTSSQSKILSVVDYQLLQQQQTNEHGVTTKSSYPRSISQATPNESQWRQSNDDYHLMIGIKENDDNKSALPTNFSVHRRSSTKIDDNDTTFRLSQYGDLLHMQTIYLNDMISNEQTTSIKSFRDRRSSLNDDNRIETEYKWKQMETYPKSNSPDNDYHSSSSNLDNLTDDEENRNVKRRPSLLNENARRLFILGTIRPSKTFYKDLPEVDVEYLMEYFHRMRKKNQKMTSDEINHVLQTKFKEYKPKIFFDSSGVTKNQIKHIEQIVEEYADKIRIHNAELAKLDNPIRFIVKQNDNDRPLTIIPNEYNDCFITLVARTDPLHKSNLITELVQGKLLEDIKENSLDISYFPGGINYDIFNEQIDESGEMKIDTYHKLKKRLHNRKIWYFNGPPEKKPNALLAILPSDSSINMNHLSLLDCLYQQLKSFFTNEINIEEHILSMEFIPLNCIWNSDDIQNQFIIDCHTIKTKEYLLEKPLKVFLDNKNSFIIELRSYDEYMQNEYEKSMKANHYRQLIKNHDEAIQRISKKKS